ncbi:MAG: diguanylate cyclase [Parasphingorhabdus sp.]|uniref:sensor domain-containing diguanylate cyclase n=1 Tax=Parasphingorhabdus sp. TaxID=2709688 RepID=UPI0032984800
MSETVVKNDKWWQNWSLAGVIGIAYCVAASLALDLTQGAGGIATIWPASGIFVSALLLARPGQTFPLIASVGMASMASNLLYDVPVSTALAFTCANLVEGLLISQLIIRTCGVPKMLEDTRLLATFFGATLVGSLVSGAIATGLGGDFSITFFVSWFLTVCLGTLIVTPVVVTIAHERRDDIVKSPLGPFAKLFLGLAIVATIGSLLLSSIDGRFLFLPVIGVIAATYFFGARGAAISISFIAILSIGQTDFSSSKSVIFGLHSNTLFLQFYLLSLLCAVWPLSALMAAKAKLIDQYAQTNALLKMAENTAQVGHWYLGSDNSSLVWSEEVYRIHGIDQDNLEIDESMDLEESSSLKLYHPKDRENVRRTLLTAMENQGGFAYQARIIRPDGTIRHVSSIGQPRFSPTGEFEGLFGTFQDISEQTETLEALRIARSNALREAATAQRLAETDELTGIANRRKALARLRTAARAAKRDNTPLTIAIFDIDHFKSVNDRFGHQMGDKVLRRVAKIVTNQLRPEHLVGRMGGEEFLVILPGEDARSGFKIIEKLRLLIANQRWNTSGLSEVTVSAGLVSLDENDDIDDALRRADEALYKAKQDGRNLLRLAA